MKNNLQSLAVLALALLPNQSFAGYEELVSRTKPCVVEIKVQTDESEATGTGFFVSSNGCVMTNWHVINDAERNSDVRVTGNDGSRYLVQGLVYVDKAADLAILKCDCTNVAYLEPAPNDDVAEGEAVLVIGNPEGLQGTVSTGIVSAIRQDVIQISAPISFGSSGSPVINQMGQVIGVVRSLYEDGQNLNFCVPLDKIRLAMLFYCQASG